MVARAPRRYPFRCRRAVRPAAGAVRAWRVPVRL